MSDLVTVNTGEEKEFMLSIQDGYAYDVRHFIGFMEDNKLELDSETLKAYVDSMKRQGVPARTIIKRLQAAKKRIRQLFEQSPDSLDMTRRWRMEEYLKTVKAPKIQSKAIGTEKIITLKEWQQLISSKEVNRSIALIIEFLFLTGARITEVLNVRLADIKQRKTYSLVRVMGKGGKERYLKVEKELIARTKDHFRGKTYLFESRGSTYDRSYVSMKIKRYGRKILGKDISAHSLRHSFATLRIQKTGKIKGVSEYMGHSSTSITLDMYVHEELTMKDLRA